jgi:hypothetical protein
MILAVSATAAPAAAEQLKPPAAPGSAQPAGAVPGGFATWGELFAMQDKLNAAATRIVGARGAGYAGIVAAPATRRLTVYWKGAVPQAVRNLAGRLGVPVTFTSARFTERELLAEAKRLGGDAQVLAIGPKVDGSGLHITVSEPSALRSGLLSTARVPLQVSTKGRPQLASRQNDSMPYYGGARYTNMTTGAGCTTGWGLFIPGEIQNPMLTAGHCGNDGEGAMDGGANPAVDTMGVIFGDNDNRDTMIIDTPSDHSIYTGPNNSNSIIGVFGVESDFVGNLVCDSGATTGEQCGIEVTEVNGTFLGFTPMVTAEEKSGACVIDSGDSGAPVFTYNSTFAFVRGRGTVTGGWFPTADCSAVGGDSNGSSFVVYAPLQRPAGDAHIGSLQFYNASLLS